MVGKKSRREELIDGIFSESEQTFDFVSDEVLRKNLSITLGYIVHLVIIRDIFKQEKVLHTPIARDIVVHVSAILEGVLFYCFEKLIENGEIQNWQEICKKREQYVPDKVLHEIDGKQKIVLFVEKKVPHQKNELVATFAVLVEVCKDTKILTPQLFKSVEEIRRLRKTIHLANSKSTTVVTAVQANDAVEILRKVIVRVKKKLNI